jgi:glycerophosphoryl diester phosphodiesterase
MKPLLVLCLLAMAFVSCNETPPVAVPTSAADILLQETHPLTPVMRSSMEGVYSVLDGSDVFGSEVVLKWSYSTGPQPYTDTTFNLSFFSGPEACFFDLQGGSLDSVFVFAGYWRKMLNSESGYTRFTILSSQGGRLLFQPNPDVKKDSIVFTGTFGAGSGMPDRTVTFKYSRPLYNARKFAVIAHRGGGRTSDMLPVSENSVEMILFTPRLGTTTIEVDVRTTKDDSLIIYHDNTLNTREIQKTGLVGTVENYTYAQLQGFVRLIHGERIPTLRQAMEAALYRTPITSVYLDNKPSANLALEREVQKEFIAKAAAAGRQFNMFIGLPSDDILNSFLALPDYATAPSLCELTVDDTRKAHSLVWAPRWTLGLQLGDVAQMHAEGRAVVTWTVDVPAYMQQYITQGDFDGILSNYSPAVAFYHYSRQ